MEQPLRGSTTEAPAAQGPRRQTLPSPGSGPSNMATPGTQPAQLSLNGPQCWALSRCRAPHGGGPREGSNDRESSGPPLAPSSERASPWDPEPGPAQPSCRRPHRPSTAPVPADPLPAQPPWARSSPGMGARGMDVSGTCSTHICCSESAHLGSRANHSRAGRPPLAPPGTLWAPGKDGRLMQSAISRLVGPLPRL